MNFILEAANRQYGRDMVMSAMYQSCIGSESFQKVGGWNFFGILRNDMMAESNLQKLLNVDVFGRAMIGNIFGKVKRGDHVGLILRRVRTDQVYGGFMQPAGNILPSAVIKQQGNKDRLQDGVLQLLPSVNGECCLDGLNGGEDKVHYPLGVVTHAVGRIPNSGQRQQALRSQTTFTLLPRIEILMI